MNLHGKDLLFDLNKSALVLSYDGTYSTSLIILRAIMITEKIFGENSNYISQLKEIRFQPTNARIYSGIDLAEYITTYNSGRDKLLNLISVMIEDLEINTVFQKAVPLPQKKITKKSNKIFIVHGHNEEMKQSVARFVEKIKFDAVILHEQANEGKTIIEKFKNHSDVPFAIVLLSPDDLAIPKDGDVASGKLRARQNVIFELGFFLGKLGNERVIVLHQLADNFEIPSDYQGVIYTPYDHFGNWKFQLVKELKAGGATVDANDVLY